MRCRSRRVADGTLLSGIKRWLTAPVIERDQRTTRCTTEAKDRHRGTPQGSPISPLLANLYFRRFLLAWERSGHRKQLDAYVVNYADDLVICCRRPGNGSTALATMRQLMTRLGLTVNETKTRLKGRLPEEKLRLPRLQHRSISTVRTGHLILARARHGRLSGAYSSGSTTRRRHTKHAEDPELRVVAINRLLRGWAEHFNQGPVLPTWYKFSTLVCSTASATMVGATQRTSGHRIPPVSGQVSLRDAWPLCSCRAVAPTGRARRLDDAGESRMREICMSGCVSRRRLACSAGGKPAGVKSQSSVVWIAEVMETENSEAYRRGLPRGGRHESTGP